MSRLERDRPNALSVPEMLRIMDVATTIRLDRELVEEQLNFDQLKERLKERMIAASGVTGETVTPEEVEAAIRLYYSNLHTFREPKLSPTVTLAHAWVRRREILSTVGVLLLVVGVAWWFFLSPNARLSGQGRVRRQVERLSAEIAKQVDVATALARDPKVTAEVTKLTAEADAFRKSDDPKGLESIRDSLATMEAKLAEEYTISVVPGADRKSAVDRYFSDRDGKRNAGFYLIVEAKAPDGKPVKRRIHDDQSRKDGKVSIWAERVPEAVYQRLKKDKLEDGVVDETEFAVKRKGSLGEEMIMKGADGRPLSRLGQITEW